MTGITKSLPAFLAGVGLASLGFIAYLLARPDRADRAAGPAGADPATHAGADRSAARAPSRAIEPDARPARVVVPEEPGEPSSAPQHSATADTPLDAGRDLARPLTSPPAAPASTRAPRRYLVDDSAPRPAGPETEGRQQATDEPAGSGYESWYLDGMSDDGHVFTALFLMPAGGPFMLDVALYRPDGGVRRLRTVCPPAEVEAAATGLALRFGAARLARQGADIRLTISGEEISADLTLTPLLPAAWRMHKKFTVGDEPTVREFCAVRTVPLGAWKGTFRAAGEEVVFSGTGYHNHIWTKNLTLTAGDLDSRRLLWLRVVTAGSVVFVTDRERLSGERQTEATIFDRSGGAPAASAGGTLLLNVDVLTAEGSGTAPKLADGMPPALFVGLRDQGALRLAGGVTLDETPGYRRRRFQATLTLSRAGVATTEPGSALAELVSFAGP